MNELPGSSSTAFSYAARSDICTELFSNVERRRRGTARADDRHCGATKNLQHTATPQHRRDVRDREQRRGKPGMVPRQHTDAGSFCAKPNDPCVIAKLPGLLQEEWIEVAETLGQADP